MCRANRVQTKMQKMTSDPGPLPRPGLLNSARTVKTANNGGCGSKAIARCLQQQKRETSRRAIHQPPLLDFVMTRALADALAPVTACHSLYRRVYENLQHTYNLTAFCTYAAILVYGGPPRRQTCADTKSAGEADPLMACGLLCLGRAHPHQAFLPAAGGACRLPGM